MLPQLYGQLAGKEKIQVRMYKLLAYLFAYIKITFGHTPKAELVAKIRNLEEIIVKASDSQSSPKTCTSTATKVCI